MLTIAMPPPDARALANAPAILAALCTGNIGCMIQIGSGTQVPVVHTVECWTGLPAGPCRRRWAEPPGRILPDAC